MKGGSMFRFVRFSQIMNLKRVSIEIVELFLGHTWLTERVLRRGEPALCVQLFEQIPNRIKMLLVIIRLKERDLRGEVMDIAIAFITDRAHTENRFITPVAGTKGKLARRFSLRTKKIASLHPVRLGEARTIQECRGKINRFD